MTLNLVMGAVVGLTFVACIIIVMVRKDCSPPWYYCTDYGWQSGAHGESDELNREMVAFGVATFTAFVGFMMMYQFLLYCWLNHAVSEKASSDAAVVVCACDGSWLRRPDVHQTTEHASLCRAMPAADGEGADGAAADAAG